MNRRINLTGKNSNDIYTISYPNNLLYFMKYDFNLFMERCIDLCKLYMKTGDYRQEEAAEIRNSISGCHKYFEQNLRSVFEKIVIDCWVEYICRQNEIGVITLWNNYIPCRTEFERAVFMRLSEYRHGHAINQWVNILKVQEYANIKVDFIFGKKLRNAAEAAARANYFDLMFNVVSNEMGYDLNAIADNKVYTTGRTPNSPFIMSNVSREIVRNLLADMRYSDDSKLRQKKSEAVSDQTAMDAFSSMKAFLPRDNDNIVETMIKSLAEVPAKVYVPAGLKAAVDLEIDAIIESEAYLQKCELCKDYYMRSEEYDYGYCDNVSKTGRSCLEVMADKEKKKAAVKEVKPQISKAQTIDAALLNERCERLYKEMSSRINVDFTQRDFSDWCRYLAAIRDNILNGKASLTDFENFADYSRSMSFLPGGSESRAREAESAKRIGSHNNKPVKPFVFERVDRRDIVKPENKPEYDDYDDDYEEPEAVPVIPAAPRVSSKIIRGVVPEVYASSGVAIPHGSENHNQNHNSFTQPVQQAKPASAPVPLPEEEDVRIYSVKTKEPEEREEYVKVFKPKAKTAAPPVQKKAEVSEIREIEPIAEKPKKPQKPRTPAFSPAPAPALSLSIPKPQEQREPEKIRIARDRDKEAPRPAAESEYEYTAQNDYASQKAEETQEIGFADILKGLERKDGFEGNIPTDSEGVPVSHKTKRVMDAIYRQSRPSLFINLNKGDE